VQLTDTLAIDNPAAGPCSMVAAPLVAQAQLRGTLLVSNKLSLSSMTVEALGSLASDVSLAVEAVALAEDLHRRRSERYFRALVKHSDDVILVIGRDGDTTFASPAAESLLSGAGSDFEALVAMTEPTDRLLLRSLLEQAQAHG